MNLKEKSYADIIDFKRTHLIKVRKIIEDEFHIFKNPYRDKINVPISDIISFCMVIADNCFDAGVIFAENQKSNKMKPKEKISCEKCIYKKALNNLLARIHRDGGHYITENGLKKAIKDADKILANFLVK